MTFGGLLTPHQASLAILLMRLEAFSGLIRSHLDSFAQRFGGLIMSHEVSLGEVCS